MESFAEDQILQIIEGLVEGVKGRPSDGAERRVPSPSPQRRKDTVSEKTNRPEPSRPPWMVSHSVEASWRLYICIPAKSSSDRREESASDVPVPTAAGEARTRGAGSGRALPPAAQAQPAPGTPGAAHPRRDPRRPRHPRGRAPPPPGARDTSALRAEDRDSWRAPTPHHKSVGGSRQSRYPSRAAPEPSQRLRPRNRGTEPGRSAARMRQPHSRARFPPRLARAPSRRPAAAPPAGREEILRPGAVLATALVPGPSPHPERLLPSAQAAGPVARSL